ncbi:MAG: MBL fold metallo-hydrolase, partial [Anaerolineae bacterium]
ARTVIGMGAWEKRRFGSLTVTAVPALHLAVTTGYVLESDGRSVYFAGDTYYGPFIKELGQRFRLAVALMPVTTFRIPMTMGEKAALRAVQDLRPSVVVPIHLGVRPRSPLLRTSHTPESFSRRVSEAGLEVETVILREGDSWTL